MKKIMLLAAIFTLVFTSCSSDEDSGSGQDQFAGNWKLFGSFEDGEEIVLEDCEYETTLDISNNGTFTTFIYESNLDGNCELEYSVSGTWENLGGGLYSTTSEGDTYVQEVGFEGDTMFFDDVEDGIVYRDVFIRD
ncbi:lipocalin family protein [Psychroserpens sp. SPM9]|uniref:lipocalin family protein n=1 Tax=Psychroserpens sp. SPM9 TaxID=2975598 RepID=UPI0021A35686|nr:lipocalin family protein [Psychroserpens sp. SPM9]MDG5490873.1 lipocalin family protein [Psychroserpens sp. SPM9]